MRSFSDRLISMYYLRKKRFAYYAIKRTQIGKRLKYFMKYMKLSLICHISEFRRPFHPGVLSVSLSKQFLNRYDFTARVFQITSQISMCSQWFLISKQRKYHL